MEKLDELIKILSSLQGIGRKSAVRIAFDILSKDSIQVQNLVDTISTAYSSIKPCEICNNLTDKGICNICNDIQRDIKTICIVENARDVIAIENAKSYNGLYHILGGRIDPLNGVRIEDLNIKSLVSRLDDISEIILALNPDIEGETTSLYLTQILKQYDIKISKIASGIPINGILNMLIL